MSRIQNVTLEDSLLDGQGMRAGDGVSIQECEELPEGIEEGPVGQQADALVGVDGAARTGRVRVGKLFCTQKAQPAELLVCQAFRRIGLIELDGSAVNLKQETRSPTFTQASRCSPQRHEELAGLLCSI